MFLSIVIPQYNESLNLKRGVLDDVYRFMKQQKYEWEVIIIDDGSTDDSFKICETKISKYKQFMQIQADHKGKPGALYSGIKLARGEWILTIDMDQSTPIFEVTKLLKFTKKNDVIIGSRGNRRNNNSLFRKFASRIFSTFRKPLILSNIKDSQCGFKLFRANLLKQYFPKLTQIMKAKKIKGWSVSAFDVELLFLIDQAGYKIKEVPVNWNNTDTSNTKERKFIVESFDMAKQVLVIQARKMLGQYKA